jgi:DNA polymerase III delta prime subunit
MLKIHNNIKNQLNTFIKYNKIPNILFHGESGCGKKTIVKQFLHQIYDGVENKHQYIMIVNCAQGRGIKFIREELKFFSKTNTGSINHSLFKSIILINADKLTTDAQSALRRCIELFTTNTRFFIIIEDKTKLLKPILSRFCDIYVPLPIMNGDIVKLHDIYKVEQPTDLYKSKHLMINQYFMYMNKNKHTNIFTYATKLYENGANAIDLIKYIEHNMTENITKYMILIYINKLKYEIRNEKLLMLVILNIYYMRNDPTLNNIINI